MGHIILAVFLLVFLFMLWVYLTLFSGAILVVCVYSLWPVFGASVLVSVFIASSVWECWSISGSCSSGLSWFFLFNFLGCQRRKQCFSCGVFSFLEIRFFAGSIQLEGNLQADCPSFLSLFSFVWGTWTWGVYLVTCTWSLASFVLEWLQLSFAWGFLLHQTRCHIGWLLQHLGWPSWEKEILSISWSQPE